MSAPHGPSSSSIRPFASNLAISLLITLASCGPYLGVLTQTGSTLPVSILNRYPLMGFCSPCFVKQSQYVLIITSTMGLYVAGQSLHCIVSLNSVVCFGGSKVMMSLRGGNCSLCLAMIFPLSSNNQSSEDDGSRCVSGSMYFDFTCGLQIRLGTMTLVVPSG